MMFFKPLYYVWISHTFSFTVGMRIPFETLEMPWVNILARIYIELELENDLPKAIQFTLDNWTFIQLVDYDQILFKSKQCHEYGNLARNFPKIEETQKQ